MVKVFAVLGSEVSKANTIKAVSACMGKMKQWTAILLFLIAANCLHAAGYSLQTYTEGSGYVTRIPTNAVYPQGSSVTIRAYPSNGWYFNNWTGDIVASTNPASVYMDASKAVTAHFLPLPLYSLNVGTIGQGTVSLFPSGGVYESNSVVTVVATPDAGWRFLSWSGDVSSTNATVQVTMNTNHSMAGTFVQYPAITRQPQDVGAVLGQNASFDVTAMGTLPLNYQWYFNNTAMTGETNNAVTINSVDAGKTGYYFVAIKNDYGSITSRLATLFVTNSCNGTNNVTTYTDEALRSAMALGGIVRFCVNGKIILTNTIVVNKDVVLDGTGSSIVISGNKAVRLFQVNPGVSFTLTNIVLADGYYIPPAYTFLESAGAAIYNQGGNVGLCKCVLTNNNCVYLMGEENGHGGAICNNRGTVTMNEVLAISNNITGLGFDNCFVSQGRGGVLYTTNGLVNIYNSTIVGNYVKGDAVHYSFDSYRTNANVHGGAIHQDSGTLVISNTCIQSNKVFINVADSSLCFGGAIFIKSGTAVFKNIALKNNTVSVGEGSSYYSTTFGGGLYSQGTVDISDSQICDNESIFMGSSTTKWGFGIGGGICNKGTMTLNRCLVSSNRAKGSEDTATVKGGLAMGGGIFSAGKLLMTNCTVSLNSAQRGMPVNGVYSTIGSAYGGGLYVQNDNFYGINNTISSNALNTGAMSGTVAQGAGVYNSNGVVSLRNTIIAGAGTNGNFWGAIRDEGYNLNSDGSASFNSGTSFSYTDPLLLPLSANGGPTMTMALRSDSPAWSWGSNVGAPGDDQRGYRRLFRNPVAVGAFQPVQYPLVSMATWWSNQMMVIGFEAKANITYQLQSGSPAPNPVWTVVETFGPFTTDTNVTKTVTPSGSMLIYQVVVP